MNLRDVPVLAKMLIVVVAFFLMVIAGYLLSRHKICESEGTLPWSGMYFAAAITLAGIGGNMLVTIFMHHLLPRDWLPMYQSARMP